MVDAVLVFFSGFGSSTQLLPLARECVLASAIPPPPPTRSACFALFGTDSHLERVGW